MNSRLFVLSVALFAVLPLPRALAADPAGCDAFDIVGAAPADRDGGTTGPSLAAAVRLTEAARELPFGKYLDNRFLKDGASIRACFTKLGYRYSPGDRCSVEHLLANRDRFGATVAVLMDSGGAHSIAMAAELTKTGSYLPVWKMGSRLDPKGVNKPEEDLASFRFQFPEFKRSVPDPAAAPVFILDAHRGEKPMSPDEQDNSAPFATSDFPPAAELKAGGIQSVIYITEGHSDPAPVRLDEARFAAGLFGRYEQYENAPLELLRAYFDAGLAVYHLRISPYDCAYSRRTN